MRKNRMWLNILVAAIIACTVSTIIAFGDDDILEYENVYHEVFEAATEDDFKQLERVVYWEAARAECPLEVEIAVVETVCNRVLDPNWPNTIAGVCTDKRYGRQFVCKYFIPENDKQAELVSDAIEYVMENGRTVLPSTNYLYFATKKQSCGKNHILIGTKKGHRMYFCESK